MAIPNLKRIKVTSLEQLSAWLSKQPSAPQQVMLVTLTSKTNTHYISREDIDTAVQTHGWSIGFKYTLKGDLLGHVISKGEVAS